MRLKTMLCLRCANALFLYTKNCVQIEAYLFAQVVKAGNGGPGTAAGREASSWLGTRRAPYRGILSAGLESAGSL